MLSRYLKFKSFSSKKKDKEISLTAQDDSGQDSYTVKIPQSILTEHSEFFHDMTKIDLKKHRKTKLEGVTVVALQKLVEFIQKGEISFQNHSEALETLQATEKYKIKDLEKVCIDHLITILETSNACEIFETASSLALSHLQFYCLKYIDEHADDVLSSRGFVTVKKPTVRSIISRDSLKVKTEKSVFTAVVGWGFNESLKKGVDPNDQEEILKNIKSLLPFVRFSEMSEEDLDDPEVSKYLSYLNSSRSNFRERSISTVSNQSTCSGDGVYQKRQHVLYYTADLNVFESPQHTIKNGETFCLRIEVLKGTVFLTGVNLALAAFAQTKDTACLYAVVTATNVLTMEQTTKRGAFLNTSEKASLVFPTALFAKESERIEIALSVKRAENVCPYATRSDVQIAMPDSKTVAMKITLPAPTAEEPGRCIFKEIEYFY